PRPSLHTSLHSFPPRRSSDLVTHSHLGVTWKVPVDAFWQSHISASAYYARWVADRLNGDMHTVWDLYGGCGALSAGLLGSARNVAVLAVAGSATTAGREAFGGGRG